MIIANELDFVGRHIAHAAFAVHAALGPGLEEKVYRACLTHELEARGLKAEQHVPVPVRYNDLVIDEGFRLDLLVNQQVPVKVLSVDQLHPTHHLQMVTHLKHADLRLGFLINFSTPNLNDGLQRIAL